MNRQTLAGLVAINLVLLTALAWFSLTPATQPAHAQMGARAGDYVMVAGQRQGRNWATIFIIDLANGAVLTVEPNPSRKNLTSTGFQMIGRDLEDARIGR